MYLWSLNASCRIENISTNCVVVRPNVILECSKMGAKVSKVGLYLLDKYTFLSTINSYSV